MCDVDCAVDCKLLELRALHLYYAMGDVVGLCDRLPKLDSLCFYNAEQDLIERVLQRVGVRMRSLKISDARPQLLLGQVVGLCPNLQSLTLQCDSNDMFGAFASSVSRFSPTSFLGRELSFVSPWISRAGIMSFIFYDQTFLSVLQFT